MHDTLADGRPFRILTVVDNWSRHSPVLEAWFRMTGETVGQVRDRVLGTHAAPRSITVDHGTEFQSRALEDWAYRRGVQLDFIRPGKPVKNAVMESLNGRLRDACLTGINSLRSPRHRPSSKPGGATIISVDPIARSGT